MSSKWDINSSVIRSYLTNKFFNDAMNGLEKVAKRTAIETGNWGRSNAYWKDRTGLARQTTGAEVMKIGDSIFIVMYIAVYYGKFLELANAGKYKIVEPMLHFASNKLQSIMKGLKGLK